MSEGAQSRAEVSPVTGMWSLKCQADCAGEEQATGKHVGLKLEGSGAGSRDAGSVQREATVMVMLCFGSLTVYAERSKHLGIMHILVPQKEKDQEGAVAEGRREDALLQEQESEYGRPTRKKRSKSQGLRNRPVVRTTMSLFTFGKTDALQQHIGCKGWRRELGEELQVATVNPLEKFGSCLFLGCYK